MNERFGWNNVQQLVAESAGVWNRQTSVDVLEHGHRYTPHEQVEREQAYDEALHAVDDVLATVQASELGSPETQNRVVSLFARSSSPVVRI